MKFREKAWTSWAFPDRIGGWGHMGLSRFSVWGVAAALLAGNAAAAAPVVVPIPNQPVESDPAAKVRHTEAALRTLLRRQAPDWSPEASAQRLEVGRLLENLLDAEEMARQTLDQRWAALLPDQRAEFVQTLGELAHQAFLSSLVARRGKEVRYEAASVDGSDARVPAELTAFREGGNGPSHMRLEYRLARKNGQWLVYDVVVDGVSLVASYKAEFARFLKHRPFEALLSRMKRKLEDEQRMN
jgi:phospholipid transport system substrate-binding protein